MRETGKPTIAVVIPTHNRRDFLLEAVDCVLQQTRPADEIVVVDNGETPLADGWPGERVTVHRIHANAGAARARNEGAKLARSDFIALLDDDDLWEADYLRKVEEVIHNHRDASYIITRLDRLTKSGIEDYRAISDVENLLSQIWITNPGVGGTNSIFRREKFLELGGFDSELVTSEDRSLMAKFLLHGNEVRAAPHIQAIARVHTGTRLTNPGSMATGKQQFLRKHSAEMPHASRLRNRAVIQWFRFKDDRNPFRLFGVAWWLLASKLSRVTGAKGERP